jgi:hypothetical protein
MTQHHHDHEDPTRVESESEREERERANTDRRELTRAEQEELARREAQTTPATGHADARTDAHANPPRTTSRNWFTAPKFGSAGSGGAEFEPGPEKD